MVVPRGYLSAQQAVGPLADARFQLRFVRSAIYDFRDSNFSALLRQRSRVNVSTFASGLLIYVALAFAILAHVPYQPIINAAFLVLIAAIVGAFGRMAREQDGAASVEDYGLATSGAVQALVLSGMAGLIGVVLTAYGLPVAKSSLAASETGDAAIVAAKLPTLKSVFDLAAYPVSILIAAGFGITPRAVLARLEENAAQLKTDIKSVET